MSNRVSSRAAPAFDGVVLRTKKSAPTTTVTLLKADALPQLKQGLKDADSGVRYWAAMGFLMRGKNGMEAARDELRAALKDSSPTVRVVAARALGEHGNEADLALALPVLFDHAPADRNGAYISILTLNGIDALGAKAASLAPALKGIVSKDPAAAGRANGYADRLLATIASSQGTTSTPEAKRAKKK